MPAESGDAARHKRKLQVALDEALVGFPDADRDAALEAVDYRWLGIGIRLGMERPEQARRLLDLLATTVTDVATPDAGSAEGAVDRDAPAGAQAPDEAAGSDEAAAPGEAPSIPVASMLLARIAAMPRSELAEMGPDAAFRWAAALNRQQVLWVGRVILEMQASGASQDIGRGFGLVWDAGVKLPRHELDAMFREFTELEVTVGSVLAERDLRIGEPVPPARSGGIAGWLGGLVPRLRPEESRATAAIEQAGEPGQRGLVALWNVWMAMRYRDRMPAATFDLLLQPWLTVVGPIPRS